MGLKGEYTSDEHPRIVIVHGDRLGGVALRIPAEIGFELLPSSRIFGFKILARASEQKIDDPLSHPAAVASAGVGKGWQLMVRYHKRNAIRDPGKFETTRWSLIQDIRNAGGAPTPEHCEALASLCALYWDPIYAFFRRRSDAEQARDLTQGFFARLIEKNDIAKADENRGRFRNWLLKAATSYQYNDEDKVMAKKRGGGMPPLSFDLDAAEGRYDQEPADDLTPERLYERRWAQALLERALHRLGEQYEKEGQAALFEKVQLCLVGGQEQKQQELAGELAMAPATFRQHVLRCKGKFGKVLREEVAQTVSTEDEVDEELRYLLEIFRSC